MNTTTPHGSSLTEVSFQKILMGFKKLIPERQEAVIREIQRERKVGSWMTEV